MSDTSNLRYELKFVFHRANISEILGRLQLAGVSLEPLYPQRCINNIYLDTCDLQTYYENLSGAAVRNKFRIRWYQDTLNDNNRFQFEIKSRYGQLGDKSTEYVEDALPASILNLSAEGIINLIRAHTRLNVGLLVPTIYNSYARMYFMSRSGVRVTVDSAIRSKYLLGFRDISMSPNIIMPDISIVEFKGNPANEYALNALTRSFDLVRARLSKYSLACQAVHLNGFHGF